MIENFYPNPIVVQRLQAGPLSMHIDTFVQQLFDEGYARWTAKYAVRLLADLTTWMQQQGLTITDLAELSINTFFQHRYQIRRPHRDDRAILKKLLAHLRTVGVIASPAKAVGDPAYASIVQAFRQHLACQRNLAPSTIHSYLNTVVRFLSQRFGTMSLNLDALCAQDVTGFMLQQARSSVATWTGQVSTQRSRVRICCAIRWPLRSTCMPVLNLKSGRLRKPHPLMGVQAATGPMTI
jgi:site-specific recombinase XerD